MSVQHQIISIGPGHYCESLTHDIGDHATATHMATVGITRDVVAVVRLCDVCTAGLMAATHSAGG